MWCRHLCLIQRDCWQEHPNTESNNNSRYSQHGNINGTSLQCATEHGKERSSPYWGSPTPSVGDKRVRYSAKYSTNIKNAVPGRDDSFRIGFSWAYGVQTHINVE